MSNDSYGSIWTVTQVSGFCYLDIGKAKKVAKKIDREKNACENCDYFVIAMGDDGGGAKFYGRP
jgi:hypothetical protein